MKMGGGKNTPRFYIMPKLKILMCSEASFIHSGFGIYTKELLSRLHATQKYEIAEFASYGFVNDPRDVNIHWKYYANAVRDDDYRHKEYISRGDNQFGRWRFEKVLLDFKPDVVIDIRDYWMTAYQRTSPLRKFFHWILMPTVDSCPQQEEWIDTFLNANAIFTYSDWGAEVLNKQSSGKINYIDTVSPGIDCDVFKPKNRNKIRESFGIPQDSIVIGSVMRNQKRKLIPELLTTFKKVLDNLKENNQENLSKKLFLYLHTSYPDMGWDIPELLRQSGLANKVLFTYLCRNCKDVTCSKFQGPNKICTKCHNKTCNFPSVTDGVTSESLSNIYNIFDLYVQYSICEGFGMPQVEAGACGVPIATVNYSAMCDIVNKLNAYPIKIKSEFKELETKAIRVYPDNDDLAKYILDFIKQPDSILNKKRFEIHELTHKHYDWTNIAKKWENYLDKLDNSGYRANWNNSNFLEPIQSMPDSNISNNFDNILMLLNNNLKDISLIGSQKILELLNHADYGFIQSGPTNIGPFSFKEVYEYLKTIVDNNNQAKSSQDSNVSFDEDFIAYSNMKRNS
jgi:glycosyltransferase involved in cell wall biosynthesis